MLRMERCIVYILAAGLTLLQPAVVSAAAGGAQPQWPEKIQVVLEQTKPLQFDRGQRLPLYLWPAMNPGPLDTARAEQLVRLLNERGVGLVCSWNPHDIESSLESCLPIARAQKKLHLRVNINATACLYSFFNGSEQTAHLDEQGRPFWDDSFGAGHKIGCPFTLETRRQAIAAQLLPFLQRYKEEDLPVDFIFADWEIDGPIEWNNAWQESKRCTRCRKHIRQIDSFLCFQKVLREIRCDLQRQCYAERVLEYFPDALVGNYAVYPNNGYRYWFDYFEKYVPGQPALTDQKAKYRHWYNEFAPTGYTFAMPVVYTWYQTWNWYDFENPDYRWFYNMLLTGSNAGQYTPASVPIITFVHWHTTAPPDSPDQAVQQFSEEKYQELLWHLLLRGHDTFFLWCRTNQQAKEVQLVHEVYSAAQQYGAFLEKGRPLLFDVPSKPGTVVSALRLADRLLVRRTDFADNKEPVQLRVAGRTIAVPAAPGRCQILKLNQPRSD